MELQGSVWGSLLRAYHSEPLDIQRPRVNPLPFYFNRPIPSSFASVSKQAVVGNHSYENVIFLHVYFNANQAYYFNVKGTLCPKIRFDTEALVKPISERLIWSLSNSQQKIG